MTKRPCKVSSLKTMRCSLYFLFGFIHFFVQAAVPISLCRFGCIRDAALPLATASHRRAAHAGGRHGGPAGPPAAGRGQVPRDLLCHVRFGASSRVSTAVADEVSVVGATEVVELAETTLPQQIGSREREHPQQHPTSCPHNQQSSSHSLLLPHLPHSP